MKNQNVRVPIIVKIGRGQNEVIDRPPTSKYVVSFWVRRRAFFFTSGKNWKSYKWRRGMTVIVVTAAVLTVSPGFSYTAEKP